MLASIIEFLAMLNPFALFLYLEPVRKDLSPPDFLRVIFKASLISLFICLSFFFLGTFVFDNVFRINFESFRIFGGIVIFSYAYLFIVRGQKALFMVKENLDDLASEIALPFMVGAGVISLSILMSQKHGPWMGSLALSIIYLTNFLFLVIFKRLRDSIERKKYKTAFDKNMEILLRLNGFFIGSIGVDMIMKGIMNMLHLTGNS